MSVLRDACEEIYQYIFQQNSEEGTESIPHSDAFVKRLEPMLGLDAGYIKKIIGILKDSHKIFILEIEKEDRDRDIRRVEGYIVSDLTIIRKLKATFQRALEARYEEENRKRLLANQIIKEIFPRLHSMKNSALGMLANKAIMVDEYENLLMKEFHEYTEEWKADKLKEVLESIEKLDKKGDVQNRPAAQPDVEKGGRAVDSPQYNEFKVTSDGQSLSKVLQIYGIEFFYRVNLRRYNFDLLTLILENGQINRRNDIILLKSMVQNMKANMERDPELAVHADSIYKLERTISRAMAFKYG